MISNDKRSHHVPPPNQHFFLLLANMNGTQRRTPLRMHCVYCGMPKGTSQVEATLSSEKIKLVALAIVELHWSEGIS